MSHDGYLASHDVVHRRRLYINASGSDIRGEDTLEGSGDHKFSIRFHLHPSVKASLVQDGTSVLLRLPDKSGWRMRCSGGIASLQESIYLGDGQETKRTEQIVIVGASQQGAAQVKWALTKLTVKNTGMRQSSAAKTLAPGVRAASADNRLTRSVACHIPFTSAMTASSTTSLAKSASPYAAYSCARPCRLNSDSPTRHRERIRSTPYRVGFIASANYRGSRHRIRAPLAP